MPGRPAAPGMAQARPTMQNQAAASGGGKGLKIALIAVGALVGVGLVVSLVVLLLSGGGGGDVAAVMPDSVDAMGAFDADALRSSWIYAEVHDELDKLVESEDTFEALGVGLDTVSSVSFGAQLGKKKPRFATVMVGAFDKEKVDAFIAEELGKDDDDRKHTLGGATFYGRKKREVAGFSADDTIVMGSYKLVKSIMKVASGDTESAEANESLTEAIDAIDTGGIVWGAATLSKALAEEVGENAGPFGDGLLGKGDRIAASLSLSGDLVLQAAVLFAEEERATKAKEAIDKGLEMADATMEEGAPVPDDMADDVKAVREGLEVELAGSTLTLKITVPRSLLEKGVEMGKGQLPELIENL